MHRDNFSLDRENTAHREFENGIKWGPCLWRLALSVPFGCYSPGDVEAAVHSDSSALSSLPTEARRPHLNPRGATSITTREVPLRPPFPFTPTFNLTAAKRRTI